MKYYSQYGQDDYLDKVIFKGKRRGTFVDVGAHDGVSFSNTFFFESFRQWEGICIEPNPQVFAKLVNARKNSTNLNLSIGTKNCQVDFLKVSGYAEMLSGVKENYEDKHLARLEEEVIAKGGTVELIKVKSKPLSSIFNENQLNHIDYISIDVEGGEVEVLKSIDFSNVVIEVFSIENNYKNEQINKIMIANGYSMIKRIKCDEIYIKRKRSIFSFLSR